MIGVSLCALLFLGQPSHPKSEIEARYREFNEAVKQSDGHAMASWYQRYASPAFTYTSKDRRTFKRNAYLEDLKQQVAMIHKPLKSLMKVSQFEFRGKSAVATVITDFEGAVKFDTKVLRLTDKSTTRDTWKQGKAGWRLAHSIQTKADIQMFEK